MHCTTASRHNLGATIRDVLTSPDSTSPALDPQKPASPTMADEIGRISPTTASLTFPLQPQLSQQPNANICYTAGVIAASTSTNFAPPSPTPPNTNISGCVTSGLMLVDQIMWMLNWSGDWEERLLARVFFFATTVKL
eukprot:scaffold127589_cov46-Cyclotella_meneghiniana.AAC.1